MPNIDWIYHLLTVSSFRTKQPEKHLLILYTLYRVWFVARATIKQQHFSTFQFGWLNAWIEMDGWMDRLWLRVQVYEFYVFMLCIEYKYIMKPCILCWKTAVFEHKIRTVLFFVAVFSLSSFEERFFFLVNWSEGKTFGTCFFVCHFVDSFESYRLIIFAVFRKYFGNTSRSCSHST